jgi:WD40 repeat protein
MPIRSIAFDPSAELMAVGYEDGCIRVADWWSGEWLQTFVGHEGRVQSLTFSPAGDVLASASFDGTIKLWPMRFESRPAIECETMSSIHSLQPASLLATSADLRLAAAVTQPKQVTVFDLATGDVVAQHHFEHVVGAISLSATDSTVVYGVSPTQREVWQWDWKRGEVSALGAMPKMRRVGWLLSNDGRYLVGESENLLFDVLRQQTLWTAPYWGPPRSVVFSPDGRTVAINRIEGPRDRSSCIPEIIDLDSANTHAMDHPVSAVSNGGDFLVAGKDSTLQVLKTGTHEVVCDVTLATKLSALSFSPDDKTLAMAEVSGDITLWNLATGLATVHFPSPNRVVHALRFSSDGRSLAAIVLKQTDQLYTMARRSYQVYVWSGLGERSDGPALSQSQESSR